MFHRLKGGEIFVLVFIGQQQSPHATQSDYMSQSIQKIMEKIGTSSKTEIIASIFWKFINLRTEMKFYL